MKTLRNRCCKPRCWAAVRKCAEQLCVCYGALGGGRHQVGKCWRVKTLQAGEKQVQPGALGWKGPWVEKSSEGGNWGLSQCSEAFLEGTQAGLWQRFDEWGALRGA